jgi:hypothetical protein
MSVKHIIQACVVSGECWEYEGSGVDVIYLSVNVKISVVSVEHASCTEGFLCTGIN